MRLEDGRPLQNIEATCICRLAVSRAVSSVLLQALLQRTVGGGCVLRVGDVC
jgi:hypothetical protein